MANFKETQLSPMSRPDGRVHARRVCRPRVPRHGRQLGAGHRRTIRIAAARERNRQFHQDGPARAGEDTDRRRDPLHGRLRPGLSVDRDGGYAHRTRRRPHHGARLGESSEAPVSDAEGHTPKPKATARDWLAIAAGMVGGFMAILDIQITNSSLAQIEGSVGASVDEGSWISTAYLIAEIIVIPLTGWLSTVFGLRRYLAANTVLFVGFSIACAWSTSLPELILFRAGQGFTGGVLIPAGITIITRPAAGATDGRHGDLRRRRHLRSGDGPDNRWLADRNLSWHYIFYLNIVPGRLPSRCSSTGSTRCGSAN